MIDRKVALAIFGALPDDKLLQALSVAGVMPAQATSMDALAVGNDNNHIVPWNERQVTYDGGQDRPALIDRMWAKPGLMNAQKPVPAGVLESDEGQYLQTGGM